MSLSPVFESDGELAADDGDLDEPFGDRSDERSARSGGGADQGFGGSDADGTWPSPSVSIGEGVSAARPCCFSVATARATEQPMLSAEFAGGGSWHHPRALCGLRADACGREACGTAWHPSWPRDDPAMDDGGRAVEGSSAADAACASAAASSGLHWRADPDRRLAPLVVRGTRAAMHAAGLHRRCDEPVDASSVCG